MLAKRLFPKGVECGVDEAGRGCLAGPVVAAAVILDESIEILGLDDSKKLNEKKREELRQQIIVSDSPYGIGIVSPQEIYPILFFLYS